MTDKITDFGEKIGGARKDMWAAKGLSAADIEGLSDIDRQKQVKKSNIWKAPDYASLYEQGADRRLLYAVKRIRDSLPAEPEYSKYGESDGERRRKQEDYIEYVGAWRDKVSACSSFEALSEMAKIEYYGSRFESGRVRKALRACSNGRVIDSEIRKKAWLYSDEEMLMKDYSFLQVSPNVTLNADPLSRQCLSVKEGFATWFRYPAEGVDLAALKPGEWVCVKGAYVVDTGFKSREEAYAAALAKEQGKTKTPEEKDTSGSGKARKKRYVPPCLSEIRREGGFDVRGGLDVSASEEQNDLMDVFKFRGGEFGNYVPQKERQECLNMAYEAFCDMAMALGIANGDISHGGSLAIAFGARGRGDAMAHYEPGTECFNLTRFKGAGSLAHEWMHSFDHALAKAFGVGTPDLPLMSDNPERTPGVPDSFKKLMSAITTRAETLSGEEMDAKIRQGLSAAEKSFKDTLAKCAGRVSDKEKAGLMQSISEAAEEAKSINAQRIIFPDGATRKGPQSPLPSGDGMKLPAMQAFTDAYASNFDLRHWLRVSSLQEDLCKWAHQARHPDQEITVSRIASTETKFVSDARKMDTVFSKSGHGYWSSRCELFARAGASYIKDRCERIGVRNDYLCAHADGPGISCGGDVIYSSPQGEEREIIDQAFDSLFDDLKELGIVHQRTGPEICMLTGEILFEKEIRADDPPTFDLKDSEEADVSR